MDIHPHPTRSWIENLLLACGFSSILFCAAFLALGEVAHSYNPARESISTLEFTSVGFAQRLNFIVAGLLLVGFAVALRIELRGGRAARLIPLFQFISGLALFGDGLFPYDPLHLVCDPACLHLCAAILMTAFFIAFGLTRRPGDPTGLMEKLAAVTRSLWSALLTFDLLRGVPL